jgi:hypothetical protein
MNARTKSGRGKPNKSAPNKSAPNKSAEKRAKTVLSEAGTLERVSEAAPKALREHAAGPVEKAFARAEADAKTTLPAIEKSLKVASASAVAMNRKLIDIAQENFNSGLEFARDLAGARNPLELMRLHMSYWHDCIGAFESQARELGKLSAQLVASANEPLRAHMRRNLPGGAA